MLMHVFMTALNCGGIVDLRATVCRGIVLPLWNASDLWASTVAADRMSRCQSWKSGDKWRQGENMISVCSVLAPGKQLFKRYAPGPGLHTSRFKSEPSQKARMEISGRALRRFVYVDCVRWCMKNVCFCGR